LGLWHCLVLGSEHRHQRRLQRFKKLSLIMEHDGSLVWGHVDIVRPGIHLEIREDERRLRQVEGLIYLIDRLRDLWKPTGAGVDKEHLSIGKLPAFSEDGTRNMSLDEDLPLCWSILCELCSNA